MRLWIRAEASSSIGFGHAMRCVALAEAALRADVGVCFVGDYGPVAQDVLRQRGLDVMLEPSRLPERVVSGDAVVFDGYAFTPADHRSMPKGVRRGSIDDRTAGSYDVDVLVNQNLPRSTAYDMPDSACVLIGPQYALVREEFTRRRRARASGSKLLVTFGGSDVRNLGPKIAAWAAEHGSFDVTLLLGPGAPNTEVHPAVDVVRAPKSVGAVFDDADVAISAAGSTTWELCAMGIPTALVQVADNQRDIGAPVAERGAALFVGEDPVRRDQVEGALDALADVETRTKLSTAALRLVDGEGARRVLEQLLPGVHPRS